MEGRVEGLKCRRRCKRGRNKNGSSIFFWKTQGTAEFVCILSSFCSAGCRRRECRTFHCQRKFWASMNPQHPPSLQSFQWPPALVTSSVPQAHGPNLSQSGSLQLFGKHFVSQEDPCFHFCERSTYWQRPLVAQCMRS